MVTAVHGVGGMGKTELAVAFADQHAEKFPAGLWLVNADQKPALLPLLGELTLDLGLPPSAGPEETGDQRGRRVLAELKRRALAVRDLDPDRGAACLVLLDNVSDPALLAEPQLAVLQQEDWLCVIITTRLGQQSLRPKGRHSLAYIPVDALGEDDAVKLVQEHQPEGQWPAATASADEAAARALVRELGGFTVAVEAVALYLGLHPEIRPAGYLARLKKEGLPTTDDLGRDPDVAAQMRHREKQLGVVLDSTLGKLTPAERTALDYAALLPPDSIPWPWLRALVTQEHPDALRHDEGYPDPWLAIRIRLEGLRLLTPATHPEIARLHRLLGAHVVMRLGERVTSMLRRLHEMVQQFALALEDVWEHDPTALWLLAPLKEAGRQWQEGEKDTALGHIAGIVGAIEATVGRIDQADAFLHLACESLDAVHRANPDSAQAARDVMVSLERMAQTTGGQPGAEAARQALEFQRRALGIALKLREGNPQSAFYGRAAAVSFYLTYQRAQAAGDQELANRCLAGCHKVLHELVTAGCQLDPPMMQLYQQLNQAAGGPPSKP